MGALKNHLLGDTPYVPPSRAFDGKTYEPKRDYVRLTGLLERVYNIMWCQAWLSLDYIAKEGGGSEASVSARLRDLRKPRFGGHTIERRHVGNGLFEYRLNKGAGK